MPTVDTPPADGLPLHSDDGPQPKPDPLFDAAVLTGLLGQADEIYQLREELHAQYRRRAERGPRFGGKRELETGQCPPERQGAGANVPHRIGHVSVVAESIGRWVTASYRTTQTLLPPS